MEKYSTYILINVTLQEVYFGTTLSPVEEVLLSLPEEIRHWDTLREHISIPILISKDLLFEEAILDLADLEEKALSDPQGKKILHNLLLDAGKI